MLHQESCSACQAENDYFDPKLKIQPEVHDAVMTELKGHFKEMKAIAKVAGEGDGKPESLKEERQSLKSARKTRNEGEQQ